MADRIGMRIFLGSICLGLSCFVHGAEPAVEKDMARLQNDRVGVAFDLANGTYDLLDAKSGTAAVKGAYAEVGEWATKDAAYKRTAKTSDISDELGKGRSLTVACAAAGKPSLLLEFRVYDNKPFVALRGGWKNTSAAPLRVNDFRPLTGGAVFAGGRWSDVRTLTSNTSVNDPRVGKSPFASCANDMLLTLTRDNRRCSLVLGALKTADFTKWTHTLPEGGISLREAALAKALPNCKLSAYLDCGEVLHRPTHGPTITLKRGQFYRFPNPFPGNDGGEVFSTIAFHVKAVRLDVAKLDPAKRYVLGFSWWDANGDGRVGGVKVVGKDGKEHVLDEKLKLPSGREKGLPKEYALALPKETCAGGSFELQFTNEAAVPNVVVCEVWLWETDGDAAVPAEWTAGRTVSAAAASSAKDSAVTPILEATDPVGKLIEPGETYLPEDSFYVDFLTADPFEALEFYAKELKAATHARPNPYDFPTVCAWYAGVWKTPGAQNHPEKSTYKINTTPGIVEEAAEIKKCGFLNYSRAAIRLVPDNYTKNNPQGWWDDEHWQKHGLYVAPYETSRKYGKGVHDNGCLAFTYFQPTCGLPMSEDFRTSHVAWLCGKDVRRALDFTLPAVQEHLKKVFAAMRGGIDGMMFDYCDDLWATEASRGGFADPHVTSTAFYRTLFRIAKDGLGPNSWIHERNLNQPNNDLTLGINDSQRTEWDTDMITPHLLSRSALRWYKNRVVINYDMDSKELTSSWKSDGWTGTDTDGRRMMLTMAYVAASRLLLANSFREFSKEALHDLTRTFPYPTEPKRPGRWMRSSAKAAREFTILP